MSRTKRVVLLQPASAGGNFEYVAIPRQGMLFLSSALAQWEGPYQYEREIWFEDRSGLLDPDKDLDGVDILMVTALINEAPRAYQVARLAKEYHPGHHHHRRRSSNEPAVLRGVSVRELRRGGAAGGRRHHRAALRRADGPPRPGPQSVLGESARHQLPGGRPHRSDQAGGLGGTGLRGASRLLLNQGPHPGEPDGRRRHGDNPRLHRELYLLPGDSAILGVPSGFQGDGIQALVPIAATGGGRADSHLPKRLVPGVRVRRPAPAAPAGRQVPHERLARLQGWKGHTKT